MAPPPKLTDGYAHKVQEHKKELMERFTNRSEFYGGTVPAEPGNKGLKALLELA